MPACHFPTRKNCRISPVRKTPRLMMIFSLHEAPFVVGFTFYISHYVRKGSSSFYLQASFISILPTRGAHFCSGFHFRKATYPDVACHSGFSHLMNFYNLRGDVYRLFFAYEQIRWRGVRQRRRLFLFFSLLPSSYRVIHHRPATQYIYF